MGQEISKNRLNGGNDNYKQQLAEIVETPMGDDTIREYFPDAKIIKYSELGKYNDIDDLLTDDVDYCFLLIEQSPNNGHWCCISKYDNTYEFFDPYGYKDKEILKWESCQTNKELGQGHAILTSLLNKEKKVIYNPIDYQSEASEQINTCGRHCCFRVLNLVKYNRTLNEYYQLMKHIKDKYNLPYDIIVSKFISKL